MIDWLMQSFRRIRSVFRYDQMDYELDAELAAHLELSVEENLQRGMPADEARRQALIRFGGAEQAKLQHREARGLPSLEEGMNTLLRNVRLSLRQFRKQPGFTATVVLTLALGIGATTSIFSVVKAVILNPLPFRQPENLVHVWEGFRGDRYHRGEEAYFISVRPGSFYDWRAQSQSFDSMSAYRWRQMILTRDRGAELLTAHDVVDRFFETLGTPAQIGRGLEPADHNPGAPRVVVISNRIWVERFGKDLGVVGRLISLDHESYEIVGVMPAGFYPTGREEPDLWTPHWADQKEKDDRLSWGWATVARLKSGVSWEQAQVELDVVAARMAKEHQTYEKLGAVVVPIDAELIGSSWKLLLLLAGGVGLLLLIACVNVANLLLARVIDREKEFSVRTALGAKRSQLVVQLFTESLVLAIAAGALGVAIASAGTRGLLTLLPPAALPRLNSVKVDLGVLVFVSGITLLMSLFFSLIPLIRISRRQPYDALKIEGRGFSTGKSKRRLGQIFVVSEFVFSLVLLILGVLLVQSFVRLLRADPGFDANNVLTFHIQVPEMNYGKLVNGGKNARREKLYEQLEQRLSAVPGVESVALTGKLPMRHEFNPWSVRIEGREPPPEDKAAGSAESAPGFGGHGDSTDQRVNPQYFQTLKLKLIGGRFLEERDNADVRMVAVVNETFARSFFPNEDPVGKLVTMDYTDWFPKMTIVGVVADFRMNSLDRKPYPEMFWSLRQAPSPNVWVMVRTKSDPSQVSAALRRTIQDFDSDLTVLQMRSMTGVISDSLWQKRLSASLIGLLAVLSLVLAGIGIYSVTSYSVSQRTREVGIRIALGANRRNVLGLIMGETCRLALVGSLLGCAAGFVAGRVAMNQLYVAPSLASSQSPADTLNPVAFIVSALFLFCVAISASYVPARRALRVDPLVALQ
jgi:predicted permease